MNWLKSMQTRCWFGMDANKAARSYLSTAPESPHEANHSLGASSDQHASLQSVVASSVT